MSSSSRRYDSPSLSMNFEQNRYNAINTRSMRVIPYMERSGDIRQDNPYHYYSHYDRYRGKRLLHELVNKGTVMEDGPKVSDDELNNNITLSLKDHQRRLVYEMRRLENCPYSYTSNANIGYLCDSVGTGKSLSILALIAANKTPSGGEYYKSPFINPISNYGGVPHKPRVFDYRNSEANVKNMNSTLVVVPHNIYTQWVQYIEHDSKLSMFQIKSKKTVSDFVAKLSGFIEDPDTAPDIVLLKSTYYNQCMDDIESLDSSLITVIDMAEYEAPQNSTNASIQMLSRLTSEIRTYGRQLRILNDGYQNGTETPQHLAECIHDFIEGLEGNKDALRTIMSMTDASYGQVISDVVIPKSGLLWNRVVFDEADTIPISNSRMVMSKMLWLISASHRSFIYPNTTPPPHRRGFIRDLIEQQRNNVFFMQYCMFTNSEDVLRRAFPLPTPVTEIVQCFTPMHARIAYESNMQSLIEAVNAGDTEEAMRLCNCETIDGQDGLIEAMRGQMQRDLERLQRRCRTLNERISSQVLQIETYQSQIDNMGDVNDITNPIILEQRMTFIQQLRVYERAKERDERDLARNTDQIEQMTRRIASMEQRVDEAMTADCPICMEEIEEGKRAIVKCCNAPFCVDCLLQQIASYRHRTTPCPCPLCRATLRTDSFTVIRKEEDSSAADLTPPLPSKEQALLNVLSNQSHKRVLLFSGYDTTFSNLKEKLDQRDIKYELLDGSDASIQKKIQRWKSGQTQMLCLNSRILGAGLNLEQATDIIMYHRQTEDLEAQIIGRAQRPGREQGSQLRVWKLAFDREYSSD